MQDLCNSCNTRFACVCIGSCVEQEPSVGSNAVDDCASVLGNSRSGVDEPIRHVLGEVRPLFAHVRALQQGPTVSPEFQGQLRPVAAGCGCWWGLQVAAGLSCGSSQPYYAATCHNLLYVPQPMCAATYRNQAPPDM